MWELQYTNQHHAENTSIATEIDTDIGQQSEELPETQIQSLIHKAPLARQSPLVNITAHAVNGVKTLIIYDSEYGNTEKIAQALAGTFQAMGQACAVRVNGIHPCELEGVDLLIIGAPTQKWRTTTAMQAFLEQIVPKSLCRLEVASFDTRYHKPRMITGSAAGVIARNLQHLGSRPLVPSESFFVTGRQGPLEAGELERVVAWARSVCDAYLERHPSKAISTAP